MTGVRILNTFRLAAAALLPCLLFTHSLQAQERCATDALMRQAPAALRAYMPGGKRFENELRLSKAAMRTADVDTNIYRIPVVVHVIHKGEQIGVGSNVSQERITSQIRTLNEDYRRKPNTPGFNSDTVGSDTQIEFVLACTDSAGNPTTGVNRVQGSQQVWSLGEDATLKHTSMWPKDMYVNIWVCDLESPYLGYSTFPVVSGIPMGQMPGNYIDGVVIDYSTFGSTGTGNYNMGRTATHELGHYLGLVHVWGDGGCDADDYCDDTPRQTGVIQSCPPNPDVYACPLDQRRPMIDNYLQYTYDRCMKIFTEDQTFRMRYVLRNSSRKLLRDTAHVCSATPTDPAVKSSVRVRFESSRNLLVVDDQSVDSTSPARLKLYSIDGKLLLEGESLGRTLELPISLPMGLYLVDFQRGKTRVVLKVTPFEAIR